ncbi:MAG: ankyrin repeat domain-containing protein [Elusimicrobiaceae bacterium]|nr:ankyrin repeat domain-containing protein [Elusimicrobiaceae bacterium]
MKTQKAYLIFVLSLVALPVLAHGETQPTDSYTGYEGVVLGEKTARSATDAITEQATQTPGDIYRGTLFGAEQKTYHSDTLGNRPRPTKKLVYDTSLIRAIKINDADRVRTLMYANVDVNEKNYAGITPLTVAGEKGNMDIIRLLVERGKANINDKSSYGVTPLIAAAAAGQAEAVSYLLKHGADATAKDDLGKTAMLYASTLEDPKTLSYLITADKMSINIPDNQGNTPLIYAVQKGYLRNVKALLDGGANANYRNPTNGLCALATAAAEGNPEMIKLLVKNGKADINLPDLEGRTPIFYAVENNRPEALQLLLSAGANPNAQDNSGATALMRASAKNYTDCINLLLRQKNTDVNVADNLGRSALMYSVYATDAATAQKLMAAKADLNAADVTGTTPLMSAIKAQNDRAAVLFIQQGADLTAVNKAGETAFSLSEQYLPNSASGRVLSVKQNKIYQQAVQKEAEALAEVQNLEQQLAQEEANVAQLKEETTAAAAAAVAETKEGVLQQTEALEQEAAEQTQKMAQEAVQQADTIKEKVQQAAADTNAQAQATVNNEKAKAKNTVQQKKNTVQKKKTAVRNTAKKTATTVKKATVQPQEINMADFLKQ